MFKNIKPILEQIEEFWRKRSTFKALSFFLFLVNILIFLLYSFSYFYINRLGYIDSQNSFKNYVFILIGLWAIINAVIVSLWLILRGTPQFSKSKIGIIFGPHSNKDCNDLIFKLLDQLKRELIKLNLTTHISIRLLPLNKFILNQTHAARSLDNSGARLVIYGQVNTGKIKNQIVEGFKTISFTIRHRTLAEAEKKPFLNSLANAMAYRVFISKERNSFFEKNIVTENISEVACFFISLALTVDGKIEIARSILENLLSNLQQKLENLQGSPQLRIFNNAVISLLTINLHSSFRYVYLNHLIENITFESHNEYAADCLSILDKILDLNRKTSDYFLQRAIVLFHFGRIEESLTAVKKAKKLSPVNSPGPHFSFAFLYLWQGQYLQALKEYRKAERCTIHGIEFILDIVQFLQNLYNNRPEKPQLLFGLAFVNENCYDKVQALKDYKRFIELTEKLTEKLTDMQMIRSYALQRISILQER
jgi:tetratricopeptide (TPR) repeat protein